MHVYDTSPKVLVDDDCGGLRIAPQYDFQKSIGQSVKSIELSTMIGEIKDEAWYVASYEYDLVCNSIPSFFRGGDG